MNLQNTPSLQGTPANGGISSGGVGRLRTSPRLGRPEAWNAVIAVSLPRCFVGIDAGWRLVSLPDAPTLPGRISPNNPSLFSRNRVRISPHLPSPMKSGGGFRYGAPRAGKRKPSLPGGC